jgi:hypothetical protein
MSVALLTSGNEGHNTMSFFGMKYTFGLMPGSTV